MKRPMKSSMTTSRVNFTTSKSLDVVSSAMIPKFAGNLVALRPRFHAYSVSVYCAARELASLATTLYL